MEKENQTTLPPQQSYTIGHGQQAVNQSSQPLPSPANTTPVVTYNQQFTQPQHQQLQQHQMPIQYYEQQQVHQQQTQPYPQATQQGNYLQPQTRIVTQQPQPGEFVLKIIALYRLSIATIVIGIILVISGIAEVAIFKDYGDNKSGGGIWGGVIVIVAGLFTLVSSRQPTNKGINFLDLVAHVVAVIFELIVLSLVARDLEYYDVCWYPGQKKISSVTEAVVPCESKSKRDSGIALYSIQVLLLCVQLAISLSIMYIGCRAFPSCRELTCLDDCWQDNASTCQSNMIPATTQENKNQANIQQSESGQQSVFINPAAMATIQQ